jgi:hypothetical protein
VIKVEDNWAPSSPRKRKILEETRNAEMLLPIKQTPAAVDRTVT